MLRIRKGQLDALREDVKRRFILQLITELKTDHSHVLAQMSDADIDKRVDIALHKCKKYEIRTRRDIRTFVRLCFVISINFDQYPLFRKWLGDTSLPIERRLDLLVYYATPQDWRAAQLATQ